MKMRTLALAVGMVAGLPMAAHAAPDFYGKFNLSLNKASTYPDSTVGELIEGGGLADAWTVESNKSRLGVRGSEALFDQGMKVIYQFEAEADVDEAGAFVSTRNSYLGLDTNAGRFFAGRYDSVVKQAEGNIDQFNNTAADIENVFFGQRRLSNTLNWESNQMDAMRFKVQIAPGEQDGGDKDGPLDTFGASLTINQDNLYAAVALEKSFTEITTTVTTTTVVIDPVTGFPVPVTNTVTDDFPADTTVLRGAIGTSLDGGIELGAMIELTELDLDGADDVDTTTFLVSGKIQADERLAIKAQLGMFDSSDLDAEVMVLTGGADYKLGKQTKMYGLVSLSDVESGGTDESGNLLSVGLEHNF